jgi:hypothetical protein
MWGMNMEQDRLTEWLEWLYDAAVLVVGVAAIMVLVTISAGIAEWMWGVMGRLGIESPLAPWFSIACMVLVDGWICLAVLDRFINKRWFWRT